MAKNGGYVSADEILRVLEPAHEDVEIEVGAGKTVHVLVWELGELEVQKVHEVLSTWHREIHNAGTRNATVDLRVEPTAHRALLRLSWLCMKTPAGKRLFDSEEQAGRLPRRAIEKVFAVAARLNPGLFNVPEQAVAEVAEIEEGKGSSPIPEDSAT